LTEGVIASTNFQYPSFVSTIASVQSQQIGLCQVLLLAAEAKGNLAETPFVNSKTTLAHLKRESQEDRRNLSERCKAIENFS